MNERALGWSASSFQFHSASLCQAKLTSPQRHRIAGLCGPVAPLTVAKRYRATSFKWVARKSGETASGKHAYIGYYGQGKRHSRDAINRSMKYWRH